MQLILIDFAIQLRAYQYQVALSIVATLLVIYGSDINNLIKYLIRKQHFIVRVTTFIFVCALGYGFATVFLTKQLASLISMVPNLYLVPSILGTFLLLGLLAQKQKQI